MKRKRKLSELIFIIILAVVMLLQLAALYYPTASLISPSEDIFGFYHESVHEMTTGEIAEMHMEVLEEVGAEEVLVPTILLGLLLLLRIQAVLFTLLMLWSYVKKAAVQKWSSHGIVASGSFFAVSVLLIIIPYRITDCIGDGGLELLGFGERFRPTMIPYVTAILAILQIVAILIYRIRKSKHGKAVEKM